MKILKATFSKMKDNVSDVYLEAGMSKVWTGQDSHGNDTFGYPHSPELFVKSDVSGMPCRKYVTMFNLNGFLHAEDRPGSTAMIFHPNELFDVLQRKVTIVAPAF